MDVFPNINDSVHPFDNDDVLNAIMVTTTMMMMTTVASVARPHAHLWPRGAPPSPTTPPLYVPRRKSVVPRPQTGHVIPCAPAALGFFKIFKSILSSFFLVSF